MAFTRNFIGDDGYYLGDDITIDFTIYTEDDQDTILTVNGFNIAAAVVAWLLASLEAGVMWALRGGLLNPLAALAFGLAWATDAHVAVALLTVVALHLVLGTFEIVYLKRTDALG